MSLGFPSGSRIIKIAGLVASTRKGRIVIPVDLRRMCGIKEGIRIQVAEEEDKIVLRPITAECVEQLRGTLK